MSRRGLKFSSASLLSSVCGAPVGWIAVLLLALAGPAFAQAPRGILSVGEGLRYAQGPGSTDPTCGTIGNECGGNLVTCAAGELFVLAEGAVTYLQGICDNADPDPAKHCGPFFTFRSELCTVLVSASPSGRFFHVQQRGLARTCYDPAGLGDCSGTTPVGSVIIETDVHNVAVGEVDDPRSGEGPVQQTRVPGSNQPFSFNGKNHRIRWPKVMMGVAPGEIPSSSYACGNLVTPPVLGCYVVPSTYGRL